MYLLAKSCFVPSNTDYFTTVSSRSAHISIPIVGLSSAAFFKSSNIRTYISIMIIRK